MSENIPIRILNLFTIMDRGGAETMVMNYYRKMDHSKVQFDFMVHREKRGAYDDEIEAMGGRIFRMPPVRPWTAVRYRKTIRLFYQQHPEYRIIHSHMSELGYYDFIEAEKTGVPVRICHAHNRPYGFDIKSPVRFYYKNAMRPHITHMFVCGEESGDWLFGKKNRANFIQMNNAVDAERFVFDDEIRRRVRYENKIRDDQLVVGHVGRFDRQKNHDFIIDIFEEIHKKNPNAILLLIGNDSTDEGEIIHRKVDRMGLSLWIRFLGSRSDVRDILQAMDVFILPSLFEGLSVASIEAQASGLPVLISDAVPIECKITDLVNVMALHDSPQMWAEEVLRLARLPRKNTYKEIRDTGFDIAENAQWLQNFYLQAVEW